MMGKCTKRNNSRKLWTWH